ncbi:MAG: OB-fold domain-containing protein [Polaromonas sp.]|nr:OB-fold domain-containing protein [Polaromonas sp.]
MHTSPSTQPLPQAGGEAAEFWLAASGGRLLLKCCEDCHEVHYFPRTLCPFCFSGNTVWFEASGRGTIYTLTLNRRTEPCQVIAYVRLEEGVTMMTNVVGENALQAAIGAAVTVDFIAGDNGQHVPMFRLASAEGKQAP